MLKLYQGLLRFAVMVLPLAAMFSPKLRQWLEGRKNWKTPLINAGLKPGSIWFHAASSGEFEQAIPLIEWLKEHEPSQSFVISFFSPSGYSIYQDYPGAAAVFYLPPDLPENNVELLDIIQPSAAILIKYEIWPGLFQAFHDRKVPLALVAARFHPDHFLLKKSMKALLKEVIEAVTVVGAQDQTSVVTMSSAGFKRVEWCGDTRFDRVRALKEQALPDELHKLDRVTLVAGSTWEKDDIFLSKWLDISESTTRILVFPHELDEARLEACLKIYARHGAELWRGGAWPKARVVIVGLPKLLSRAYRLGDTAWVGGGFDKGGIHNCLEAAVYNIPVFFGPVYQAYPEALQLVDFGGGQAIEHPNLLLETLSNTEVLTQMAKSCSLFFNQNAGATERTVQLLQQNGLLRKFTLQ